MFFQSVLPVVLEIIWNLKNLVFVPKRLFFQFGVISLQLIFLSINFCFVGSFIFRQKGEIDFLSNREYKHTVDI